MLSLKALHCFVTLVECQSFSQCAERLNLSQPTISKQIQQLEDDLQVRLFIKSAQARKRQLQLTEIGQRVYQQALQLLRQHDDLLQDIQNYQHLQVGTLKMGVPPLGAQLLTSALFEFHHQWQHIELSFLEVGAKAIEQALLDYQLDIGVLLQPINTDIFAYIELCNYPLMVVLPKNHPWHKQNTISLDQLRHQPFLLFQDNFSLNDHILQACRQLNFSPNIVCRTSQWQLLADMVYQGMGIALLPQYYTDKLDVAKYGILPLIEPNIQWHLVMAWQKNRPLSPALQAWIAILRKHFS